MRAGQGHRQLDLDEGGRGRLPPPRQAGAPLRRGRRRDGVRRAGPGRHLRAEDRDLRARLPDPRRRGRLPARGHHLRPEHLRDRDRHRGARQLRRRLHRGDALDQAEPARRQGLGRRLQRQLLVPRQRPGARSHPHRVPLSRDQGGDGHGHRQRRHGRRLRRPRPRAARAGRGRGPQSPQGRRRAPGRDRRAGQGPVARRLGAPGLARHARAAEDGRREALARARPRHHRLHRRGHRGRVADASRPRAAGRCTSSKGR